MKSNLFSEFLYQLIALLLAVVIVHTAYVTVVWPGAQAVLDEQRAEQAASGTYTVKRSLFIVIKDYEQESCFVLLLWATAIMGFKARTTLRERRQLQALPFSVAPGSRILPEDARTYARALQALPPPAAESLLPRALLAALQRFATTRNVQDVAQSLRESFETEASRLDAELSMVRYIVWAIPSIGFIGTVRGISQALEQAHRAVEGDIVGVTVSLGVAFNSTFVALIISLLVMFLLHQLQLLQERLVFDGQACAESQLLRHLATR